MRETRGYPQKLWTRLWKGWDELQKSRFDQALADIAAILRNTIFY